MSEIVDPKPELDRHCLADHCQAEVKTYEACCERIKKVDPNRDPHCYYYYFDIVHCVDHCTHPKLWPTLK